MAAATTNKPTTATAPVSNTPPAGTTTGDAPPTEASPTSLLPIKKVFTIDKETGKLENVLDGPAVPRADEDTGSLAAPTTFELADKAILTIRKGGVRVRPLSKQEVDDLEMYEIAIDEGLPKFLAVGEALYLIQQKKLYRTKYNTFAEYCEKRFGLSRQNAYMQIDAAKVTDNLSSNGLQIPAGITERVLRPLASQTLEVQVEAWTLAQAKAAGKKLTGKLVEEALKEVLGGQTQQKAEEDWYSQSRIRFMAAGYITDFEQPVSVGDDEWIDFKAAEDDFYVKLIDQPALSTWGICLAMREGGLKYRVIVNANNLRKADRTLAKDGTLTHLLNPGSSYFVNLLGAYVEHNGKLYEPDLFERGYRLKLKHSGSDDPTESNTASEPAAPAETTEG